MKLFITVVALSLILTSSVYAQDTVHVKTGWNNIGSPRSGLPPGELQTVPPGIILTALYRYNPAAGYESSDTLEKDRGYWLKVSADGIIIFGAPISPNDCAATIVEYGGVTYHTVDIGSQCWLKENLNVGVMIDSMVNSADNGTIEKYCYNDDPANCATFGGLYQWDEAMQYTITPGVQGICPPGWHIPTYAEFETFGSAVGGDGNALKAIGQGTGNGAGTNTSGFSALLAGFRNYSDGGFLYLGYFAFFWSSTEIIDAASALNLVLDYGNSYFYVYYTDKDFGYGVRCLQD